MHGEAVEYQGKTYGYIMSLLDVFLDSIGCIYCKRNTPVALKDIYERYIEVHGTPGTLQSDNRKEFKGYVKRFCQKNKSQMIQSRPYNPRTQRKVELLHLVLRKKIAFDM